MRLVTLAVLASLLVACAARPLRSSMAPGKQASASSGTVVYRRLSDLATGLEDTVAAMGPSCVRIPIAAVTSSSATPTTAAIDGDPTTTFNSGAFGPHTLTLDLLEPQVLSAIVLATEQTPAGVTTQVVEVSDDGVAWTELATLTGYTTTETVYAASVRPAPRARYVRIRSIASPSWIAFREVSLVSCTRAVRLAGDRVPPRAPVDRSGSRWVRGTGACEHARDCAMDACCAPSTCVARDEAPDCARTGCGRARVIECGCRASTCGAWVPSDLSSLGRYSVSPGNH